MKALGAVLALALCGCTPGAPLGYSSGTSWTFPLVSPLEGGPLLVPVTISGHGPYIFRIDPDSPFSAIDSAIVSELQLRNNTGGEYIDEADKARNVQLAEVHHLKIGTLSVDGTRTFLVTKIGTFNSGGHQVRGTIGADLITNAVAFGFDRKAGMAWVATQKGFHAPPGATTISTRMQRSKVTKGTQRYLTHAIIDGQTRTVHVDLGASESQLREMWWEKAGLTRVAAKRTLVDEVGVRREIAEVGVAAKVEIGGITATNLAFVPFVDERWEENELDGTIGLGAFAGHAVAFNYDKHTVYLSAESDTSAKQRIDCWGSAELSACEVPACTTASLLVPEAPDVAALQAYADDADVDATKAGVELDALKEHQVRIEQDAKSGVLDQAAVDAARAAVDKAKTHLDEAREAATAAHAQLDDAKADAAASAGKPIGRPVLAVTRTDDVAGIAVEVMVAAHTADGAASPLPPFLVVFPAGTTQVTLAVDPAYVGTHFEVEDVSPFPRACPREGACVYQLAIDQ